MSTEIPTTLQDHLDRAANDKLSAANYVDIAKAAHGAYRSYASLLGNDSVPEWDKLNDAGKLRTINTVLLLLREVDATPETLHQEWMKRKQADGVEYGFVTQTLVGKDGVKKTNPYMVPFERLPKEQRVKSEITHSIVRALAR